MNINRSLFYMNNQKKIAVSFSGGKDSTLAMLITLDYCKENNIEMICLLFDDWFWYNKGRDFEEPINYWRSKGIQIIHMKDKNVKSKEENQRHQRFSEIAKWCIKQKIEVLVTGHNMEDNIETYLMRENNNSNTWGLAGMGDYANIYGIKVIRPLLYTSKHDIIAYLQDVYVYRSFENLFPNNKRIQMRTLEKLDYSILEKINVNKAKRIEIQSQVDNLIKQTFIHEAGYGILDINLIKSFDKQVYNQFLIEFIANISGKYTTKAPEKIYHQMNFRGCIFENIGKEKFFVYNASINNYLEKQNDIFLWENRFWININSQHIVTNNLKNNNILPYKVEKSLPLLINTTTNQMEIPFVLSNNNIFSHKKQNIEIHKISPNFKNFYQSSKYYDKINPIGK